MTTTFRPSPETVDTPRTPPACSTWPTSSPTSPRWRSSPAHFPLSATVRQPCAEDLQIWAHGRPVLVHMTSGEVTDPEQTVGNPLVRPERPRHGLRQDRRPAALHPPTLTRGSGRDRLPRDDREPGGSAAGRRSRGVGGTDGQDVGADRQPTGARQPALETDAGHAGRDRSHSAARRRSSRVQRGRERLDGRGATQRRPTFRPAVVAAKVSLTLAALLRRNEIVVPIGARFAEIWGSRGAEAPARGLDGERGDRRGRVAGDGDRGR